MRPDEHKKKHRADYKKKHGISNKKAAPKETHEATKDRNNTDAQEKEVLEENDEGDQTQFARRKVSSNWDRYGDLEEVSDEEDSTTNIQRRGEDFSVLLQRSANPASQFRFQSEKDWDQESDACTTQVTDSTLEVDFGALATSLNCVPLHERLNISANHLPPDLVKEFEFNAELHRRNQSILPWSSTSKPDTNTTATTETRFTLEDTCQNLTLPHSANSTNEQKLTKQYSSDSEQLASRTKGDKDLLKVKQRGHPIEPSKPHNAEGLQTSLKDVLKTVNATSAVGGQVNKLANNEEDDELEFLLSLDTPRVDKDSIASGGDNSQKVNLCPEAPSSSVKPSNQSTNDADDELEDWLDSVLG